jgi:APA family basic amino acid/polyamine antiporter
VLVAAVSVTLLAPQRLAASASPLADAMRVGAPALAGALSGVALFATANTALITVTVAARQLFGMARGGDAPALLGRTLPRRQTPVIALIVAGIGTLPFLPLGRTGLIGSVASLLALVAFAAVNAALVRLRFTRPGAVRPFRVPGRLGRLPVPAVLGLIVVGLLLTQFEPLVYGVALAALLVGFLGQRLAQRRQTATGPADGR